MDGSEVSPELTNAALKLLVGVALALIGAILWDFNDRLKKIEGVKPLTADDVKDAVKAALYDAERS